MNKEILKSAIVNWFYTTENGEEYIEFNIGERGIRELYYCDSAFIEVVTEKGNIEQYFNINTIQKMGYEEAKSYLESIDAIQ